MKRLCIFYNRAELHIGKDIEWIVCLECQRKLKSSHYFNATILDARKGHQKELPCGCMQPAKNSGEICPPHRRAGAM